MMKRLSVIGEVLHKASSWFRENLPLKSPSSSAEDVSAHDVDEGMETENMGFTSSIALQYVHQAQVGLNCDLAWNPKHKCLKFTITNNPGRGGTIDQWGDRDRQGGWEEGGWLKDVAEAQKPKTFQVATFYHKNFPDGARETVSHNKHKKSAFASHDIAKECVMNILALPPNPLT